MIYSVDKMIDIYGREYDQITLGGGAMNKNKVLGISKSRNGEKFVVRICVGGKLKYIGSYDTYEEAVEARKDAEKKKEIEKLNKNSLDISWPVEKFCDQEDLKSTKLKMVIQLLSIGMNTEDMAYYLGLTVAAIEGRFLRIAQLTGINTRIGILSELYHIALGGKE